MQYIPYTKSSSSIDVVATDLADANTMMSKINFNTMYLQYTILGYTMQQTEDKVQTVKQLVADLKQELDAYEKYVKKPLTAKLRRTPFIGQINGVRLNEANPNFWTDLKLYGLSSVFYRTQAI